MDKNIVWSVRSKSRFTMGATLFVSMGLIGTAIAACSSHASSEAVQAEPWLKGEFVNYEVVESGGKTEADVVVNKLPNGAHYLFRVDDGAFSRVIPRHLHGGQVVQVMLEAEDGFVIKGNNSLLLKVNLSRTVVESARFLLPSNFVITGPDGAGTLVAKLSPPVGVSYRATYDGKTVTLDRVNNLHLHQTVVIALVVDNPDVFQVDQPTYTLTLTADGLQTGTTRQSIDASLYLTNTNFYTTGNNNNGVMHARNRLPAGAEYRLSVNNGPATNLFGPHNLKNGDHITVSINVANAASYAVQGNNSLTYTVSGLVSAPTGPSLVVGDQAISERLYAGSSATPDDVFAFMDSVSLGDVITGPGQQGMQMPGTFWNRLQAPQASAIAKDQTFAPYIDIGLSGPPATNFGSNADGPGAVDFAVLAFIQDADGLIPGGQFASTIGEDSDQFNSILDNINAIRARGGDVTLSFGGAAGNPLWSRTNDPILLGTYYYLLAKAGKFHTFDFDLEGTDLPQVGRAQLNAKAFKLAQDKLASEGFVLDMTLTLPVLPTGLTVDGTNALAAYYNAGIRIKAVTIMNFDFGGQGTQGFTAARMAIEATARQIVDLTGLSLAEAMKFVGTTQMPPVDDQGQPWTLEDSRAMLAYAKEHELYNLSFWALHRDLGNFGLNGANSAIWRAYGQTQRRAPSTFSKPGVDIYQNGQYKLGGVAGYVDPATLHAYAGEQTKDPITVIQNINGKDHVFRSRFFVNAGQRPTARDIQGPTDLSPWTWLGTLEDYTEYYNRFVRPPDPTGDAVPNYFFLRHDGRNYVDPHANSGSGVLTDGEWWLQHARDWTPGTTAQAHEVYRYQGQVWMAKWWAQNTPGTMDNWKVFDPQTDHPTAYK